MANRDLRRRLAILAGCIGVIWIVAVLNTVVFGGSLAVFGIQPRTQQGLIGIATAPLLHGNLQHLLANTLGLLIFGGLTLLRSERHFWTVTVIGVLASGAGMWVFG